MLRRIAPTLFQGTTGETVTLAAVARSNNGVEAAVFRYGAAQLPPRQVQGDPGCEFNVRAGTNTLGTLVLFDPGSPNARYELFEEDDSGILQPLEIIARPISGPIIQFQIIGIPATARARRKVTKKAAKRATRKTAKRTAKKAANKTTRKAAKKKTVKRRRR
jgi:hypothetical protein